MTFWNAVANGFMNGAVNGTTGTYEGHRDDYRDLSDTDRKISAVTENEFGKEDRFNNPIQNKTGITEENEMNAREPRNFPPDSHPKIIASPNPRGGWGDIGLGCPIVDGAFANAEDIRERGREIHREAGQHWDDAAEAAQNWRFNEAREEAIRAFEGLRDANDRYDIANQMENNAARDAADNNGGGCTLM